MVRKDQHLPCNNTDVFLTFLMVVFESSRPWTSSCLFFFGFSLRAAISLPVSIHPCFVLTFRLISGSNISDVSMLNSATPLWSVVKLLVFLLLTNSWTTSLEIGELSLSTSLICKRECETRWVYCCPSVCILLLSKQQNYFFIFLQSNTWQLKCLSSLSDNYLSYLMRFGVGLSSASATDNVLLWSKNFHVSSLFSSVLSDYTFPVKKCIFFSPFLFSFLSFESLLLFSVSENFFFTSLFWTKSFLILSTLSLLFMC